VFAVVKYAGNPLADVLLFTHICLMQRLIQRSISTVMSSAKLISARMTSSSSVVLARHNLSAIHVGMLQVWCIVCEHYLEVSVRIGFTTRTVLQTRCSPLKADALIWE
jgi:hypothetical protein